MPKKVQRWIFFRNNIICPIGTCFDVLVNFENQQHGAIADRSLEENKENAFDILSNLNRKNVSHYQLRIDIQEGSKCENVMSLEYFCSEYSLESECQSACGPGSQTGRCHWLPEKRYNDWQIKILCAGQFLFVLLFKTIMWYLLNVFVEHQASPIVLAARTSEHVQTDSATILKSSIQKFYVHKTAFLEVI